MKRWSRISGIIFLLALIPFLINNGLVIASVQGQAKTPLRLGGELYDNWSESLAVTAPEGNMPIWLRQTTNTISGPDTWRCVTCHGWDYQGKDGAYRAGSNYTGFPGILQARNMAPQVVLDRLTGKENPAHNFSQWLDSNSLDALVVFITQGLVDDDQFIDPVSFEVINGNAAVGQGLYEGLCANCHGADGTMIHFRFEGLGTTLGTLAVLDPWRFLHKTRFGTPGTEMGKVVGVEQQWSPQQGRDVLLYVQSLPTGLSKATPAVSGDERDGTPVVGGEVTENWLTNILNAVGSVANSMGFVLLVGTALIGFLLLAIWTIRGGRK